MTQTVKWMKKHPLLLVVLLFAFLTVVYFRYTLVVPPDALLTRSLASDLYMHFLNVHNFVEWLGQGFIPEGDYWVPRGGGFPTVPQDQLLMPSNLLLLGFYTITQDILVSLRIVMPLFYFATLITAYWYGTLILKRRDASIVFAIAYSFSMYAVAQAEHPELASAPILIMLTLIFLEKTLASKKPLYIVLTALSLYLVFRAQLYPFYYTMLFIGARLYFQWQKAALWSGLKIGALFLLAALPHFLTMLLNTPSQSLKDTLVTQLDWLSQPPFLYFVRNIPANLTSEDSASMYLGLTVVGLALLPIVLRRANYLYAFYLFAAIIAVFYSVGQYGPLKLAVVVQQLFPFAFFMRVPGRGMMIGTMALAMCAAFGFAFLSDRLKQHRWKFLLLPAVILLIFVDLTIGYEPTTRPMPFRQQEDAYEFLEKQSDDSRVIEIPATYLQMAIANIRTDHDVISSIEWAHGFFNPSFTFSEQYHKYVALTATEQESAFYGVKYVLVNTDPSYYKELHPYLLLDVSLDKVIAVREKFETSKDYKLVYHEKYMDVYENLWYRGLVFASNPLTEVYYDWPNPNTLIVDVQSPTNIRLTVSQSYIFGWVATVNGSQVPIYENNSVQELYISAGTSHVVLHYQRYDDWWLTALAFYLTLFIVVIGFLWKRKAWFLLPVCGILFTAFPLVSYTYIVLLYQNALIGLGATLIVGTVIYIAVKRYKIVNLKGR